MRHWLYIITAALFALTFTSCEPNIVPSANLADATVEAKGGSFTYEFEAENRWSVVNDNPWIYVTPGAGLPGKATVTVKVSENDGLKSRSGNIYVLDGANTTRYGFSQACSDVISIDNDKYLVPENGSFIVRVSSNIKYSISTDTEWIVLPDVTEYDPKGEEMEHEFGLVQNPSTGDRDGKITFTTQDDKQLIVAVVQSGHVDVDWGKEFYKRSLAYRFTGDWCGYCPNLAYDLNKFKVENPGRLSVMCFYDANSNESLAFGSSGKYESRFNAADKPTLVMDERGYATGIASPGYYNVIKDVVAEDRAAFPAATAITLRSSISGGKISVSPTVYVKDAGDYHIHVALLEYGLVVAQSDYTGLYTSSELKNFVHDNVVRQYMTTLLTGDAFTARAQSLNSFNYTIEVPKNVVNSHKLQVAVYVTRAASGGPRSVSKFTYYKDRAEIVDNSVISPVGQSVALKYE